MNKIMSYIDYLKKLFGITKSYPILFGPTLCGPRHIHQKPVNIHQLVDFVFSLSIENAHLRKQLALDIFTFIANPDDFVFFDLIYHYYQHSSRTIANQLFIDVFDIIKDKYNFDHVYSFALLPDEDFQPSGSFNHSYIDNVSFSFSFNL